MAWTQQLNLRGPQGQPGVDGDSVSLRVNGGSIEWRQGTGAWQSLVSLATITGPAGEDGAGIEIAGSVATYAALPSGLGAADAGDGYLVQADGRLYIWDGAAFPASGAGVEFRGPHGIEGVKGDPGDDGLAVELRKTSTAVEWRLAGGSWSTLIALSEITGPQGNPGSKGDTGATGPRGATWFTGNGAPTSVPGAMAGDLYLDGTTGTVYVLS